MKPDEGLIEVLRTQVRFAHLSPQAQTTRGMGEAGGLTRWGQRVVVAAIPHVHDLLVDKNFDGTPNIGIYTRSRNCTQWSERVDQSTTYWKYAASRIF